MCSGGRARLGAPLVAALVLALGLLTLVSSPASAARCSHAPDEPGVAQLTWTESPEPSPRLSVVASVTADDAGQRPWLVLTCAVLAILAGIAVSAHRSSAVGRPLHRMLRVSCRGMPPLDRRSLDLLSLGRLRI